MSYTPPGQVAHARFGIDSRIVLALSRDSRGLTDREMAMRLGYELPDVRHAIGHLLKNKLIVDSGELRNKHPIYARRPGPLGNGKHKRCVNYK